MSAASLIIEYDKEDDGRWIADVPALPGVMAYGRDREDARRKVMVLALRVLAKLIDSGKITVALNAATAGWFIDSLADSALPPPKAVGHDGR